MLRTVAVFGILAVILAYRCYEPVPGYVQDKGLLTFIHSVSYALDRLGKLFELSGLTTSERLRQRTMHTIVPALGNSSRLIVREMKFARSPTTVAWRLDEVATTDKKPGLIYIHGGGWAFGAPKFNVMLITEMAERAGVTVFAISYRLSIVQPFPAAFDDCLSAVRAVFDSAADFGVSVDRIGLAGDSAGGQLAASVAQALLRSSDGRDRRRRPKLQLLIYPVTQAVNLRTESYLSQLDRPVLKTKDMASYISLYLTGSRVASDWLATHGHVTAELQVAYRKATGGQELPSSISKGDDVINANLAAKVGGSGASVAKRNHCTTRIGVISCVQSPRVQQLTSQCTSRLCTASLNAASLCTASVCTVAASIADFRVSPLLGDDLDKLGLPPAHILACEFDPLLSDAILYADRLQRSGVRIHLRNFACFHGSVEFPNDGREIRDHLVEVLRTQL